MVIEVLDQAVYVVAALLDVAVLVRVDVPDQYVHHAPVLGKANGDLLGKEEVGAIDELEAACDRVVVGEGHQRHPTRLTRFILAGGIDVALRAAEDSAVPLVDVRRGTRV